MSDEWLDASHDQENDELDQAILKAFINGKLSPKEDERIAALLERKPDIAAKIVAMSSDGFVERLRQVLDRPQSKGSELVEQEVRRPSPKSQTVMSSQFLSKIPAELLAYPGYSITKELGRGGMGVVYLAKNIPLDRLEVLKVLNEHLLGHAGAKERFMREIRAVSKLSHPNIVTSYSVLPFENLLVFAMEYVPGIDLHQYISKHKPLSIGFACHAACQIAMGLQHAYERGLVHRDIKPSNAIVHQADGQVRLKILDFGLAKASIEKGVKGGLTQDGTMLGTPEYMAPEQTLDAAKADIRADIYGLGCTLYHMLASRPPFQGTHGQVLIAHAQSVAPSLNLLRPEVPRELSTIIARMMSKQPSERFATPSEVTQALLPFVGFDASLACNANITPAAANTVFDLKNPERDTSVDETAPAVLPDVSPSVKDRKPFELGEDRSDDKREAPQRQVSTRLNLPRGFVGGGLIGCCFIFGIGMFWQLGILRFHTPDGVIVVEQLPPNADIMVDGSRTLKIAWNDNKDRAEVRIAPGTHELVVYSNGLRVQGQTVEVEGSSQTTVKLSTLQQAVAQGKLEVQVPSARDTVRFGDSEYAIFSEEISWDAARQKCIALGGQLVRVSSQEENDFLVKLAIHANLKGFWLDISDEESEGVWKHPNGEQLTYSNWDRLNMQPNNALSVEHVGVSLMCFNGLWWDYPVDPKAHPNLTAYGLPGFICEWKKDTGAPEKQSPNQLDPTYTQPNATSDEATKLELTDFEKELRAHRWRIVDRNNWVLVFDDNHVAPIDENGHRTRWHWWIVGPRTVHIQYAAMPSVYTPTLGSEWIFDPVTKSFQDEKGNLVVERAKPRW